MENPLELMSIVLLRLMESEECLDQLIYAVFSMVGMTAISVALLMLAEMSSIYPGLIEFVVQRIVVLYRNDCVCFDRLLVVGMVLI